MTKICIVGANGYIGRHVAQDLRSHGHEVLALSSRDGSGIDPRTGLLPTDLRLDGVEAVVYAAQSPHYRNVPKMAWHLEAVACAAALQTAVAAQRAGARRFVYLSTGNVYAPSFEPLAEDAPVSMAQWYPMSKLHGEQALQALGAALQVSILRIFAVYGPDQDDKLIPKLAAQVEAGRTVTLGYRTAGVPDSGLRLNPCHIDDAVAVIRALALESGPQVLNLAGPDTVGVREIAEIWARLRGITPAFASDARTRGFDLLGDTTSLRQFTSRRFVGIEDGLARMAARG
jgi:UDP-glucose 4-epimerase